MSFEIPPPQTVLAEALVERLRRIYAAEQPMPQRVPEASAIPDQGLGWDALPGLWDRIVEGGAKLASPWMIGHMDTAPHPAAALTEAVVAALNNNLLFRELSPFASRIEELLIAEFAERLGLPGETQGIFCSGGSLANLTALFAALGGYRGTGGRGAALLVVPEGAHASLSKAAAILGLDPGNLLKLPVDGAGRMQLEALEKALAGSRHPAKIVVAVLGGTVTGAVDDLAAIGAECRRYGAWYHVDAVYGGALAYSKANRRFLDGLETADSVALGPQKWLYVPRLCALTLFPNMKDFDQRLGVEMPYSAGGRDHRGKWGLQGSRRADAVTLWAVLQVLGRDSLADIIDDSIDLARRFHDMLGAHDRAAALHVPDLNLQVFRFGRPDPEGGRMLSLQDRLTAAGKAWLSVSHWQGEYVLRAVLLNRGTGTRHLSDLLTALSRPD